MKNSSLPPCVSSECEMKGLSSVFPFHFTSFTYLLAALLLWAIISKLPFRMGRVAFCTIGRPNV